MPALDKIINNLSLIFFTNIIIKYDKFLIVFLIQIFDWNDFISTDSHYIKTQFFAHFIHFIHQNLIFFLIEIFGIKKDLIVTQQ